MAQTTGIMGLVLEMKVRNFIVFASPQDVHDIKVLADTISELESIRDELQSAINRAQSKQRALQNNIRVVDKGILELKILWIRLISQVGQGIAHTDGTPMWNLFSGRRNRPYAYTTH